MYIFFPAVYKPKLFSNIYRDKNNTNNNNDNRSRETTKEATRPLTARAAAVDRALGGAAGPRLQRQQTQLRY